MNSIILSAIWGVIMMFSSVLAKKEGTVRMLAILGAAALLVANILEMDGISFFSINTHNMLVPDNFSLLFNCIAFGSVLLYFLLSGKDIAKVGPDVSEY